MLVLGGVREKVKGAEKSEQEMEPTRIIDSVAHCVSVLMIFRGCRNFLYQCIDYSLWPRMKFLKKCESYDKISR